MHVVFQHSQERRVVCDDDISRLQVQAFRNGTWVDVSDPKAVEDMALHLLNFVTCGDTSPERIFTKGLIMRRSDGGVVEDVVSQTYTYLIKPLQGQLSTAVKLVRHACGVGLVYAKEIVQSQAFFEIQAQPFTHEKFLQCCKESNLNVEVRPLKVLDLTGEKVPRVYHVANPDVPGTLTGESGDGGYVGVVFDTPVGFSGNRGRGLQVDWHCDTALLFPSPEEARAYANRKET